MPGAKLLHESWERVFWISDLKRVAWPERLFFPVAVSQHSGVKAKSEQNLLEKTPSLPTVVSKATLFLESWAAMPPNDFLVAVCNARHCPQVTWPWPAWPPTGSACMGWPS